MHNRIMVDSGPICHRSNTILFTLGNNYLARNQVFGLTMPTKGDQQGQLKGRWNSDKHHGKLVYMRCYLVHVEDGLQASRSPVRAVDDNEKAKSVKRICAYHTREFQER